ncbi:helical backbone metal receptor [Parvicella tangerina]|uniref:Vitamin B12-binding protein n=1 Tax=Parvicella tangerina TaxID=2829795 RepID=A0A916NBL4_9FLAO|nr:helical backbone metal receptor [Parvicella tangerina]CAG5083475.1 Vitamin B12-binding protein [Parvicella tangerina]
MTYPVSINDQMNRELKIYSAPQRIISLVPSITELLYDLGLKEEVIGLTKFCIHPKSWCSTKTKVGGTKKLKTEQIKTLQPDLIIGNKEENTPEDIFELEKKFNVLMTDVNSFEDALEMIKLLGIACDRTLASSSLISRLQQLKVENDSSENRSAIYLIWNDPIYAVGRQTFINDMMRLAGFKNLIKTDRYPEITVEDIQNLNPELLLLSTEPFPFGNKHLSKFKTNLKNTHTIIVDGEMFSWYGSRLLQSFEYFNQLKTDLEPK